MAFYRASSRLVALPVELRQSIVLQSLRHHSTTTFPPPSHQPHKQSPPPPPSSSVNPTETTHFSALASSWWDPHGPSRILHLMNPLRHDFISRCRSSAPSSSSTDLRYLDIGCGGGIFAESAARLRTTRSVTAIDPTPSVIDVARAHQRRDPLLLEPGRLTYLNKAIEDLPVPSPASTTEGVDVLSLFEVIEHIRSPAPFLEQCLQHVKPGGWFVLSTISRTWTSWFTTKVMAEDVMRVVPRGTHDWAQYINAAEMQAWAKKQRGWGDVRIMGVIYVPGLGWREVNGSEGWGNYFLGMRRLE